MSKALCGICSEALATVYCSQCELASTSLTAPALMLRVCVVLLFLTLRFSVTPRTSVWVGARRAQLRRRCACAGANEIAPLQTARRWARRRVTTTHCSAVAHVHHHSITRRVTAALRAQH